jgi:hypothetical protein
MRDRRSAIRDTYVQLYDNETSEAANGTLMTQIGRR